MTSRKFAAIFLCIFLLGALPLVMAQSYGTISAGLSAGFMASLQSVPVIALFFLCGLLSVLCSLASTLFLPACTILLFLIGAGLGAGMTGVGSIKLLMLVWLVLFGTATHVLRNRTFLVFALAFGIPAFWLGGEYVINMPDTVAIASYLIGGGISAMLLCGIGICVGITSNELMRAGVEKLKNVPVTASFFTWLL